MHTITQNQAYTCIHNLHEHTTFLHAHILTCINIHEHIQSPLNYVFTHIYTHMHTQNPHTITRTSPTEPQTSHTCTQNHSHKGTQLQAHIIPTKITHTYT